MPDSDLPIPSLTVIGARACLVVAFLIQLQVIGILRREWNQLIENNAIMFIVTNEQEYSHWKCTEKDGYRNCEYVTCKRDWLQTVQTFATMACFGLLAAVVLVIKKIFSEVPVLYNLLTAVTSAAAAYCILFELATLVQTEDKYDIGFDYRQTLILVSLDFLFSGVASYLFYSAFVEDTRH